MGNRGRRRRPDPGERIPVEELKETEANPWVLLGREEMAGGGGSAEHGGRR